jgi:hypothetical protein
MAVLIQIRDVVRGDVYELGPDEPVLRGSYDLFRPVGPVRMRDDGLAEWREGTTLRTSRVSPTTLGDLHPGERVLVQLGGETDEAWWVCDVEAVDGVAGDA